jgi:hypothetical protein
LEESKRKLLTAIKKLLIYLVREGTMVKANNGGCFLIKEREGEGWGESKWLGIDVEKDFCGASKKDRSVQVMRFW